MEGYLPISSHSPPCFPSLFAQNLTPFPLPIAFSLLILPFLIPHHPSSSLLVLPFSCLSPPLFLSVMATSFDSFSLQPLSPYHIIPCLDWCFLLPRGKRFLCMWSIVSTPVIFELHMCLTDQKAFISCPRGLDHVAKVGAPP